MNFRAFIAIIVCKLLRLLSRLLHRGGTAMPGRIALKICPNLLAIVSRGVKTVAVTGTNGKTTSARMIEQAFIDSGISYFANRSGANLISGITTEFVMNSSLSGKCRREYAVIECDEAASKRVFPQLKPELVVVTNIFRDQLDRYGEVTFTLSSIREALESVPEAVLCLNADCSLTSSLADDLPNRAVFYGIEQGVLPSKPKPENSDAPHCLRCKAEYEYSYVTYGHLGGFRCPACGYSRRAADYAVTAVTALRMDSTELVMSVRGEERLVKVNLPAVYNIYNAAGAVAAVTELGLGADAAISALADFKCGFGRMESFRLGKAGARMMLVKNPAGCNQVLDFLSNIREHFCLVLSLNDRAADGTDISWIWDADFELLSSMGAWIDAVVVAGDRAAELANRIKYAGFDPSRITVERDYERLVSWAETQEVPVLFMPTYTSMLELREVVIRHCGGDEFWV